MSLPVAILLVGAMAALPFYYWEQMFGPDSVLERIPFNRWLLTGLVLPASGWLVLNCGVLPRVPPLIPEIAIAKYNGGHWVALLLRLTAPGLLVIGTYWTAISFGRLLGVVAFHAESRRDFAVLAGVLAVVVSPLVWLCGYGGGLAWAGVAACFWLIPATHFTWSMAFKVKPVPMYARAIARMKLGKYREAEQEVIEQLEKREDDFDGWMMLAELYATQFGDLAEADRTVRAICDEPSITPVQVSLALNRLADWHLKLGDDPVAARRALEEVGRRMPQTHVARLAELRARQLPASRQEWLDQKKPRKIALPALTGELGEPAAASAATKLSRSDVLSLVNECVERLKRDPNATQPREKLARLLTEELEKPDLGIDQLELLMGMPGQPESKKAEWLSLLAAWQFRYRHDRSATRVVLARLVQEFPGSAQGFAAQRWLNLLEMEDRFGRGGRESPGT
jgi:hypothetical protein